MHRQKNVSEVRPPAHAGVSQSTNALYCAMVIFASCIAFFSGCADREELRQEKRQLAPGYNPKANESLEKAESAMVEAGIEVDFGKLGGLESVADLRTILPDPMEIRQLEKQEKMEDAIDSLYDALDAIVLDPLQIRQLEKPQQLAVAGAPARALAVSGGVSNTDLTLIHIHLSYLYTLSAVSRLARAGVGPDGIPDSDDDLYYVSFSEDTEAEGVAVYKLMLTDKGQALMDAVDLRVDPYGYIRVFYNEGQAEALQAIIDSLLLLLGAEVGVIENPAEGIRAHEPMVDRETYRHDALYHMNQALLLAELIVPQLEDALSEFDEVVTEYFSKPILQRVIEWGFKIRSVPERYEYLLEP
jgi:hypothetical protein